MVCVLMLQTIPAFCQDQQDIVEKLMLKYEDVEAAYYCDTLFCVKKNGSWEFADADGNLLTNMHITEVSCPLSNFIFTLNDTKYSLYSIENGQLMVMRYDRYAYMDKKGKLTTPFVYDFSGEKVFDAAESKEALNLNDKIDYFIDKLKYSYDPPVDDLLDILTPANAHLLTDEYTESLVTELAKFSINNPDKIDKIKLNALFDAIFNREDCSFSVAKNITTYRNMTSDSDEEKFKNVENIVSKFNSSEINYTYGYMLQNGIGCTKNVQEAIFNYEISIIKNDGNRYLKQSQEALRNLWMEDSTKYENPYGRLLTIYDDYRLYNDYVIVRKNELVGVCDSTFTELLPCRYKDFYNLMPPLFVAESIDDQKIIVKTGGEALTKDSYEDVELLKYKDGIMVALVKNNDKWGIIDVDGHAVTPMVFDNIYVPWIFLYDTYPKITVGMSEYELITLFFNNRAIVRQNELYGIISNEGEIVVPCKYLSIDEFKDGQTSVEAIKDNSTTVNLNIITGKESTVN